MLYIYMIIAILLPGEARTVFHRRRIRLEVLQAVFRALLLALF